jgi:hypothetical protein
MKNIFYYKYPLSSVQPHQKAMKKIYIVNSYPVPNNFFKFYFECNTTNWIIVD